MKSKAKTGTNSRTIIQFSFAVHASQYCCDALNTQVYFSCNNVLIIVVLTWVNSIYKPRDNNNFKFKVKILIIWDQP